MADRYWVGGGGTWNATNTTNWAATSGGTGGESVPTSADNVFFDANSGGTCYFDGVVSCADFSCISAGVVANSSSILEVYGSFYASTGVFSSTLKFLATSTGKTVRFPSSLYGGGVRFEGVGGEWTLQAAINTSGGTASVIVSAGSLITDGFNITARSFVSTGTTTRAISLGSSTITLNNANNSWNTTATGLTFDAGTSTIKLTDTSATTKFFLGGGLSFHNLEITDTAGAAIYTFRGSNTFNQFKSSKTIAHTIKFEAGTTNTASDWVLSGSSGKNITITSETAAGHTLVKSGGGNVSGDYLTISYSNATPSNTFYAGLNSTNSGNNSGWSFSAPPVASGGLFFGSNF